MVGTRKIGCVLCDNQINIHGCSCFDDDEVQCGGRSFFPLKCTNGAGTQNNLTKGSKYLLNLSRKTSLPLINLQVIDDFIT